ncbi:MAG: nucleotide pyrophosphohydrolase [Saprospiraceae bacterium]
MKFKELNERVLQWADDKGILDKGTPLAQQSKTEEEVAELREALFAQCNDLEYFKNSKGVVCDTSEEVTDAIGDTLITILIQCKMQNLNPLNCLESALEVIEKRTGKMIDNVFVKDK